MVIMVIHQILKPFLQSATVHFEGTNSNRKHRWYIKTSKRLHCTATEHILGILVTLLLTL